MEEGIKFFVGLDVHKDTIAVACKSNSLGAYRNFGLGSGQSIRIRRLLVAECDAAAAFRRAPAT